MSGKSFMIYNIPTYPPRLFAPGSIHCLCAFRISLNYRELMDMHLLSCPVIFQLTFLFPVKTPGCLYLPFSSPFLYSMSLYSILTLTLNWCNTFLVHSYHQNKNEFLNMYAFLYVHREPWFSFFFSPWKFLLIQYREEIRQVLRNLWGSNMDRCWTVGEPSPGSSSLVRHAESGNSGLVFPGRLIPFIEIACRGLGASDYPM